MKRLALIATALLVPAAATAQHQPLEFTVDGGFSYTLHEFSDNVSQFDLPFGQARVGVGVSSRISLEGILDFSRAGDGNESATSFFLAPGMTFHFRDHEGNRARPYVGGLVGMSFVDADSGDFAAGDTQFAVGAVLGTKLGFSSAGIVRLEAGVLHFPESDLRYSATRVVLAVGLGAVLSGG